MSDLAEQLRAKVDALWFDRSITDDDHAYLHEQIGSLLAAQQPARPVETITLQMYAILKTKLANAEEEIERMKEQQAKVPDDVLPSAVELLTRVERHPENMLGDTLLRSNVRTFLEKIAAQSAQEGKV